MTSGDKSRFAFLMIKPDGVSRRLIGEIFRRVEGTDLELVRAQLTRASASQVRHHYSSKRSGSSGITANEAIFYLTSGPIFTTAWEGSRAVSTLRELVGHQTDPHLCEPGSIRRDFAADSLAAAAREERAVKNIVHSSHDAASALFELQIWFGADWKEAM